MGGDGTAERVGQCERITLMNRHYDEAVRLMQRATTVPKNTKIDFYNDVCAPATLIAPG